MEFRHWPKIPRLTNEVWEVTEKLDGTNAVIAIDDNNHLYAGSRNRWLDPHNDNHGFCRWVMENEEELMKLSPGYYYGEWYGAGIQRGYDLKEKRFALFNIPKHGIVPECCHVVPTINVFDTGKEDGQVGRGLLRAVELSLSLLTEVGSIAVPGYMKPEGLIIKSLLTGQRYKYILE